MVTLSGALILAFSAGCYQVPVTGRSAISLVSDQEILKQSAKAFADLKRTHRASPRRDWNERVQRVGDRLSKVVFWDVPDADWEFIVFDAPQQINAFAMPGGKVGVFSGLFQILENDDQLASVLAHEIAHVAAKHANERLSQNLALQGGGLLVGGVLAGSGAGALTSNAVLDAYGLSSGVTAVGFDRKKEKEADHIGIMYMARAGYNPEESVKVIEKLEQISAGKATPPAWLSTHPSNPERILQLMDLMPKALEVYRQSGRRQTPVLVK
ncbi:MAG: M48 family metallopeptidase [bacterium]|nr:M48 family metallopeptidase [bacterium]